MVTLTGTVPSLADRDRASRAALDVVTGLRNPPIRIIVRQGDGTLSGVVNSRLEKQLARHLALHAFGVLTVTNDLRVEGEATD